jgi:hypothetical protein
VWQSASAWLWWMSSATVCTLDTRLGQISAMWVRKLATSTPLGPRCNFTTSLVAFGKVAPRSVAMSRMQPFLAVVLFPFPDLVVGGGRATVSTVLFNAWRSWQHAPRMASAGALLWCRIALAKVGARSLRSFRAVTSRWSPAAPELWTCDAIAGRYCQSRMTVTPALRVSSQQCNGPTFY